MIFDGSSVNKKLPHFNLKLLKKQINLETFWVKKIWRENLFNQVRTARHESYDLIA